MEIKCSKKVCDSSKVHKLSNGTMVCDTCREWLIECECIYLLSLPLKERQIKLNLIQDKRGRVAADKLKQRLMALWTMRKNNRSHRQNNHEGNEVY